MYSDFAFSLTEKPVCTINDGGSGHFDRSERLVQYLAHHSACVAQARLSDSRGLALKPVATGISIGPSSG